MRTGSILSMFILVTSIQLLTYSSAQCEQHENTGMLGIALILSKPTDDELTNNKINKDEMDKDGPAEIEAAEIPVEDNASDHFNRGVEHDKSGMYREAIESYKQAIMIKPDYSEAYYNLAFSYLLSHDVQSAHEEYMLLKDINPQMADDLYDKALIMVRTNPGNKYIIQVGAFRNIKNANNMIEKIKAKYLHARIEAEDGYRKVRIFGMNNKEEAEVMMKDIRDRFKIDPFLVPAR